MKQELLDRGWREVELSEVTTKIGSGSTPRGGSNAYKKEGISLIRSQNVLDLAFTINGLSFIDDKQASKLKNVTLEENDVLLNITGDSVARVCMVPSQLIPARVNQHVSIIRADMECAVPHYLLYYIFNRKRRLLSLSEIGGTRRAITKGMLEDFTIQLPPLPEQRAIAAVLSSLDDKIELLHQQNETLEALAETLFRQWFVEEAEEDWEERKLEDFVMVHRGLSYKGKGLVEDPQDGVPMHNLNSIHEGGGYKYEGIKYYKGIHKERHQLTPGDVIVSNTEQGHNLLLIGYPAIVPPYFGNKGIFSQHLYKIDPKTSRLSNVFLYFLIKSHAVRSQIAGATNGSTVNMLPKDGIEWAKFKLPPVNLHDKFSSTANNLLKKKEINYTQIQTLTQLRDTLLPKLMNGEARVAYGTT